jgi:hypothetical protein
VDPTETTEEMSIYPWCYYWMEVYAGPAIPLFLATVRCNILQLFIHKHVSLMFLIHSCLFTLKWCEICMEQDSSIKHLLNIRLLYLQLAAVEMCWVRSPVS